MRLVDRLLLVALLMSSASMASAGTIVSTVGGSSVISAVPGSLITVDTVITFGPTLVGGAGAAIELSFDYVGTVVGGGGTPVSPAGWFDLTGGSFSCVAGHCENIIGAGDFTGFGASFPSGAAFALVSITVDLTGLPPGAYTFGVGFSGPADAIVNPGAIDLSAEYTTVPVWLVIPEPGTAALLGLGLAALASAGLRDRSRRRVRS